MSKIEDFYSSLPGKTLAKNYLINGNFDIWQRGTNQSTSGYGSADRWYCHNIGTTKVHSRQSFTLGQTDVPGNPRYYSRTVVTSVAGANSLCQMYQPIESVLSLAGKTATLSFWAKADAAKTIAVRITTIYGTGGSPTATPLSLVQNVLLNTSWQKFTLTYDIPTIPSGTVLGTDNNDRRDVVFCFDAGTDYSHWGIGQQSGTFDIAQVQLEEGSDATEFEKRTTNEELYSCQRYFQKAGMLYGFVVNSTTISMHYSAIREFRAYPVATLPTTSLTAESPPWAFFKYSTGSALGSAHIVSTAAFDVTVSGFTGLTANSSASLYPHIWFDAEI